MKIRTSLALCALTVATATTAQATVIDVKFSGTVQSQIGTGAALNSPISGEFIYDTALSAYTLFTIGGQSVAAGYASAADLSPDGYTALFTAQLSPVAVGGDVNSTFSLDLEALNSGWTGGSAIGLLTSTQLASNLDTASSSFSYYMANSNGTNLRTLTATLGSLQISAVPEPSSVALLLAGVAGVGFAARRQR